MHDITPLHVACVCCVPEVVDDLIKKGADINRSHDVLQTPLVSAISARDRAYHPEVYPKPEKRLQTIKRLLSENISRDKSIHDRPKEAADIKDAAIVALLLEEKFPVTKTALQSAIYHGGNEVVDIFLTHTTTALLDPESELIFKEMFIERHKEPEDMVVQSKVVSEHMERNYKEMLPIAASYGRLETVSGLLPCLSIIPEEERNETLYLCLSYAAMNGQTEVVNFLVEGRVNPSLQRKSDGRTALHEVASSGNLDMICTLLQSCQDPRSSLETKDHEGFTPWLCAIGAGDKDALNHFMEVHPDIDLEQKTTLGLTAAHLSMESGNESVFHYLQERSVDFKSRTADGQRPIHMLLESFTAGLDRQAKIRMLRSLIILEEDMSSMSRSKNLLHLLVNTGQPSEDVNEILRDVLNDDRFQKSREDALISTDSHLRTPLHLRLEKLCDDLQKPDLGLKHHLHQVRLLANPPFEFRDHLSTKGDKLRTPVLAFARSVSNMEIIETSKDQFQSVVSDVFRTLTGSEKDNVFTRQQDREGMTVMHHVAESKSGFPFEQVVSTFLKYQIDLSIKDNQGDTPLMAAARTESENIDFLRLTLPQLKLSELEELCGDGAPLVHHICKKPGVEQLFPDHLAALAQSTVLDEDGYMPLIHLLKHVTDIDAASRLVDVAGKTIDACDNMKHSCLYCACRLGANPVVAALIDRYKMIDDSLLDQQPDGSSRRNPPLLVAALYGNVDTVRMLVQKGANVFVKGESSWQLHHCAIVAGYPSLLDFMETIDGFDFEAPMAFFMIRQE